MAAPAKALTGRHVLIILLVFFGVMVAVNIIFTVAAVKTFRGEDVPRSYRQGLEYNQTLANRSTQKANGWTAKVNLVKDTADNRLVLNIVSSKGQSVEGLEITAVLRHPVNGNSDQSISFRREGNVWFANIGPEITGRWTLVATASGGASPFQMEYELWF